MPIVGMQVAPDSQHFEERGTQDMSSLTGLPVLSSLALFEVVPAFTRASARSTRNDAAAQVECGARLIGVGIETDVKMAVGLSAAVLDCRGEGASVPGRCGGARGAHAIARGDARR
jgi:hypothetical protein